VDIIFDFGNEPHQGTGQLCVPPHETSLQGGGLTNELRTVTKEVCTECLSAIYTRGRYSKP